MDIIDPMTSIEQLMTLEPFCLGHGLTGILSCVYSPHDLVEIHMINTQVMRVQRYDQCGELLAGADVQAGTVHYKYNGDIVQYRLYAESYGHMRRYTTLLVQARAV